MSWRDNNYNETEFAKINDGENIFIFNDDGVEMIPETGPSRGKHGAKFIVLDMFDEKTKILATTSRRLLLALQTIPKLSGNRIVITKMGDGFDTEYTVKIDNKPI
jgi:hypothetical protein